MARVIFSGELSNLAGEQQVDIEAADVRALLRQLEQKYPALQGRLSDRLAMAIDGEIISSPLLEALRSDSEVHFIPSIEGG